MLLLCIIVALIPNILGFPRKIPIGGLFDDKTIQKAFEISVEAVNRNITFSQHARGILLIHKTRKINRNVFYVGNIACELASSGVAGIFGPQDKSTSNHIQSMCDALNIPYITARWDSESKRGSAINLYPHADTLSTVFYDLIVEYRWNEYAVLYDNINGLIRMNRLLKLPNMNKISMMVFQLGDGPNFRKTMQEVKRLDYRNIVIDCSYKILASVLEQAQQVGIMTENHKVIVASLDLQTLDLEPYKYSGINLTGVRLIDPESSIVQDIIQSPFLNWTSRDGSHLRVESALAYDAVQLFASGYARLRDSINGSYKKLFCNRADTWGHGFSLSNYMRNEQIHGLSGMIKFDTAGFRSEFELDIVNLKKQGLLKVGKWKPNLGVQWNPGYRIPGINEEQTLRDKHFIVLISLTDPYGMYKETTSKVSGNEQYEGFAVDIIEEMSKILGFNYTFHVQADNNYGSYDNTTGRWNGMMGKIINGEADLAITDLTITADRGKIVDFTTPFMNLGISVLYRKPTVAPPGLLSFLLPYSKEVWMYLIGAYIIVTSLLFVIGKLCPVEWTNPYPCIREPEVLETPFTPIDTPFFILGTLLKGPTGFAPAGTSTRALATAWWFFNLIIGSTYIANLASALSTKSPVWHFKVVDELAYQNKIKYGAKKGGSTVAFFEGATYEPYKIMYRYMMAHADEVFMTKNEEGVSKVEQGDYAYLMESSSIEYIQQRNCNVTQVGGLLDAKGYGIAMRKDMHYRIDLDGAILKLKENGMMNELQNKWWKQKRGGETCDEKEKVEFEPLKFEDVSGVFLIMISGVTLSWFFAIWKFLWNIRGTAIKHNVPYKEEIIEELRFLVKCGSKKIVKRRKKSIEMIKRNSIASSSF